MSLWDFIGRKAYYSKSLLSRRLWAFLLNHTPPYYRR